MIKVVDRVVVPFEGDGAGTGELSWGQRDIWLAMVRQKSWIPNGAWGPLPDGTTVEEIAGRLEYLMSRFPTARTRLEFDAEGEPRQVVSAAGEAVLSIVDGDGADQDELAEAVRLHLQDTEYDFAREWPIRMAVIRDRGVLTRLVVVMCHLVTDAFGAQVLLDELDRRATTPPPELQSLEQARWQATPPGQRQNAMALRHWEGILRAMPPRRFPPSTDERSPRHWRGEFRSPALALAMRSIAAQTGVGAAPALLAVFAIALARVTGVNPVVVRPMVNNRFRPGLDRVVCMLAQYGLCQLDVAAATFAEAIDRARRSALTTYKHAYYDPTQLESLIARVTTERGGDLELPCYFNDRRGDTTAPGPPPTPADLSQAASQAEFRWTTQQDIPFEPLIVHIDDVPGATSAIIFLDTAVISPSDAESLLRGLETVAVEAATNLTAPTGVH